MSNKPTPADVGRVYTMESGSQMTRTQPPVRKPLVVRVVLVTINSADKSGMDVYVKPEMPDSAGEWPGLWVDFDRLTPTGDRAFTESVQLNVTLAQAALLHSIVRESGWSYTESRSHKQIPIDLLELADLIRAARGDSSRLAGLMRPDYHKELFDSQFEDASDRIVILGVDE